MENERAAQGVLGQIDNVLREKPFLNLYKVFGFKIQRFKYF
jgi:hypothetical protein